MNHQDLYHITTELSFWSLEMDLTSGVNFSKAKLGYASPYDSIILGERNTTE